MKLRALLLFLLFSLSSVARARIFFDQNYSVRALGMGNAYTALADDASCLFYNPAGLARASGLNLKIFSLHAGGKSMDNYEALVNLTDSSKFADSLNDLYGESAWLSAGGETVFYMPLFAVGAYNHLDASLSFENPVYPAINARVTNDTAFTAGFGFPIGPFMEIGANLRYIKRSGAEFPFGPSSIADLNTDQIESEITKWGRGYGADLGMNLVLPAPFFRAILGVAWKNVGETHFRSADPDTHLPHDPNDVNVGAAFAFNLPLISVTPAIEFKHLSNEDIQPARKLNLGIELGLPLIDIRAGFSEGYYTAGVGLNLGLFKVEAATFGVELGDYPGQQEDRRYIVEFTMELGLGNFSVSPNSDAAIESAGEGGKGGGRGGSGSRSRSLWGGKGLKQRR